LITPDGVASEKALASSVHNGGKPWFSGSWPGISLGPAGVMAMACRHRRPDATRETSSGDRTSDQLATGERWAGPREVAERLVVPTKPGNAGGGKGPQLKTDARSNEGHGD
jgi:hypothetical protein